MLEVESLENEIIKMVKGEGRKKGAEEPPLWDKLLLEDLTLFFAPCVVGSAET